MLNRKARNSLTCAQLSAVVARPNKPVFFFLLRPSAQTFFFFTKKSLSSKAQKNEEKRTVRKDAVTFTRKVRKPQTAAAENKKNTTYLHSTEIKL